MLPGLIANAYILCTLMYHLSCDSDLRCSRQLRPIQPDANEPMQSVHARNGWILYHMPGLSIVG